MAPLNGSLVRSRSRDQGHDINMTRCPTSNIVYMQLGWQKLDEYYTLIDDSPAYVASICLYPRYNYAATLVDSR